MYPSLSKMKTIAKDRSIRRIPLCHEIMADAFTPIEVMRTLRAASHHCFLLESAENNQPWSRYSFLGYDPSLELTCLNGRLRIRSGEEDYMTDETIVHVTHPGIAIRKILTDCKSPKLPGLPPLHRRPCRLFLLRLYQVRRAYAASGQHRECRFPRRRPHAL